MEYLIRKGTGKVALVTGASRGVGAAVVQLLAQGGTSVVLNYRSKGARAEEIAERIGQTGATAMLAQADITRETDVRSMLIQVKEQFQK